MFFLGGIDGVFGHQVHGLAATDQLTRTGMQNFNNVAAEGALVHFILLGHVLFSLSIVRILWPGSVFGPCPNTGKTWENNKPSRSASKVSN
jgi:hypothetical protein